MKKPNPSWCDICWENSSNQYHCNYLYCHGTSYGCFEDCSCKKNRHKPHPCMEHPRKEEINYCECKKCPNCGKFIN